MSAPNPPSERQVAETVAGCCPDFPFGCAASWGPPLFRNWGEARKHVCNLTEHHEGEHVCHCGERTDA